MNGALNMFSRSFPQTRILGGKNAVDDATKLHSIRSLFSEQPPGGLETGDQEEREGFRERNGRWSLSFWFCEIGDSIGTDNHAIEKVFEFHLRDLLVLHGEFLELEEIA